MHPDIDTRKFALELGVRIACEGSWLDANRRVSGAIDAAQRFLDFIDAPQPDPARAPTAAAKAA